MLAKQEKRFWSPIPQVQTWLRNRLDSHAKVLDIGPGHAPLSWATNSIDFVDVPGVRNLKKCNLAIEKIPYADKTFDLVYARHILEDMYNPFHLIKEMERVGKSGYIETPSPIAELGRGVDGNAPWRGYHHHRFLVWVSGNELRFVSKYALIEYLSFDETSIDADLRFGAKYWNSYFYWRDTISFAHRQSPLDFDIPRDYGMLLADAMKQSKASTDTFWSDLPPAESESMGTMPQSFCEKERHVTA